MNGDRGIYSMATSKRFNKITRLDEVQAAAKTLVRGNLLFE